MSKIDELAKVLIDSTEIKDKKKTSAYDTTARVVAVEGNTAWVSIAGGVEKTPASMVVAAKVGDDVRVRVGGGKAYVTGNQSAPPTDDSYARKAEEQAIRAYRAADSASKSATEAQKSANLAIDSARIAGESATKAIADAATAHEAADSAQADAINAQSAAEEAAKAAEDADKHAGEAEDAAFEANAYAQQAIKDAGIAQASANSAQADATTARNSADTALFNLSVVEDVVGVLDLVSKNGTYEPTTDDVPDLDKWYFIRTGSGVVEYVLTEDEEVVEGKTYYTRTGSFPYEYIAVESPTTEDISTYYEFINDPFLYQVEPSPATVYHLTDDTEIDLEKTYYTRTGTGGTIYSLTEDETVVEGKTYYTRAGSGTEQDPYVYTSVAEPIEEELATYYEAVSDPYVYTEVETPSASALSTYYEKYYELTGVADAIRNYVSNHLVVDQSGVWLKQDNSDAMLQLTTTGVKFYNELGHVVAEYGTETIIGDKEGFNIRMGVNDLNGELGFYQGNNKVAYINNNKLYINQSVVVEQMDVGLSVADGGLGQWSWKLHENTQGLNNLNLKWIG